MAEEIKKDGALNEEQLDQVAGGYADETTDDIMRFKALRILPDYIDSKDVTGRNEQLLKDTFRRYGVEADTKLASNNTYRINGRTAYAREVWDHICRIEGINNPFDR